MLHEIDAITGAVIDLHFAYATGQHAVLPGIGEHEAIDARLYPQSRLPVAQCNEPVLEYLRLPDLNHACVILDWRAGATVNLGSHTVKSNRPTGIEIKAHVGLVERSGSQQRSWSTHHCHPTMYA